MDALRDKIGRSNHLANLMIAEGAKYHLRFGAGRRLLMLWHAYRNLLHIVWENRKEPLTSDESGQLTQDLNAIYINIAGTLDNLCWAIMHELEADVLKPPPPAKPLSPSKIGLFKKCLNGERFAPLNAAISFHSPWYLDLKTRRDPAAHRIPLAVPPQKLRPEEGTIYWNLFSIYQQAVAKLDFEAAENIMEQIERIGCFSPVFLSDPTHRAMQIYPTVPDDVGHLIDLFEAVDNYLVGSIPRDGGCREANQ